MSEWIKCSERLPEDERYFLAFDCNHCMWVACWYENNWVDMLDRKLFDITHWMPLPKEPEE